MSKTAKSQDQTSAQGAHPQVVPTDPSIDRPQTDPADRAMIPQTQISDAELDRMDQADQQDDSQSDGTLRFCRVSLKSLTPLAAKTLTVKAVGEDDARRQFNAANGIVQSDHPYRFEWGEPVV